MSLSGAITALSTIASTLTGVVRVYGLPPTSISEYPAVAIYPLEGQLSSMSDGMGKDLHTIRFDIYVTKALLPEAVSVVLPWPAQLRAALAANPTLSGAITTIVWPISYRVLPVPYGAETPLAMRFTIPVKIMEAS